MILFHLQTLGAERHIQSFLNFWIIKFWKIFYNYFFENVTFFRFWSVFLKERDRKRKNDECDDLGNPIQYKIMLVSATQVKICGRRCIFSGQSAIFQEREKHIVTKQY